MGYVQRYDADEVYRRFTDLELQLKHLRRDVCRRTKEPLSRAWERQVLAAVIRLDRPVEGSSAKDVVAAIKGKWVIGEERIAQVLRQLTTDGFLQKVKPGRWVYKC